MTEAQLRSDVVNVMRGWLGWSEKNGKHKAIIDLYNTQRPLPRGYPVKYTDEWCATTVTAAGMAAGLHDIVFGDCQCLPRMGAQPCLRRGGNYLLRHQPRGRPSALQGGAGAHLAGGLVAQRHPGPVRRFWAR